MIKSASTKCGDNEHDPTVWREYRVASAEAAAAELVQAWKQAGWRGDRRSTVIGDATATHLEVSGSDLDDHCSG